MVSHIVLGIIQGFTEFFPVSSSAHLVFAQKLFGIRGEELVISLVLHLGTVLSLCVFFSRDIIALFRQPKTVGFIAIVTVITGIIGVAGKKFFESLFAEALAAAAALIVTGVILIFTQRFMRANKELRALNNKDAVSLGLAQAFAIIPGISRSGMTISTLLFRGIDRETSFRFSFLAAIPAVLGAVLLESKDIGAGFTVRPLDLIAGFCASFLSGLFALSILRKVLRRAKLHYFGYYCILAAMVAIIWIR
jgi:undecaprenyl-diphosphatase